MRKKERKKEKLTTGEYLTCGTKKIKRCVEKVYIREKSSQSGRFEKKK